MFEILFDINLNLFNPICKIEIALLSEIASFVIDSNNKATLSLNSGANWQQFFVSIDKIKLKEKAVESDAGTFFQTIFDIAYRGDTESTSENMKGYISQPLVVKITLRDKKVRFLGTDIEPMKFFTNFTSDNNDTLRNIQFKGLTTNQSYWEA